MPAQAGCNLANRVTDLLGSYNLGVPGSRGYRGKTQLILTGLLAQLAFGITVTAHVLVDRNQGSATGGGGDGLSTNSPYRVRHQTDFNTLWTAIKTAAGAVPIELKMRRGDILRPDPTATGGALGSGFVVGQANVKLTSYGSSSHAPFEITGFVPINVMTIGTPWATSDSLTYTITLGAGQAAPQWVRVGTNLLEQLEKLYMRATTTVAMPARSFNYNAGTRVLTVKRDDAMTDDILNTLEIQITSGPGVTLTNHDLIKLSGWNSTGWGMESDTSANYCITSAVQGSNLHQIDSTGTWWGPQHVVGAVSSGGATNGTLLFTNNRFGLGIHGASGMTGFVDYRSNGGHETVMIGNVATHGSLRTTTYNTQYNGEPWYWHTGGDGTPIGFVFRSGNTALNRTDHMFGQFNNFDNNVAVTDQADLSQYRIWIEKETLNWDMSNTSAIFRFGGGTQRAAQYFQCSYRFSTTVPAGLINMSISGFNGQMRRCRLRFVRNWTGFNVNIFGGGSSGGDFIGCSIECTTTVGNDCYLFGDSTGVRFFRTVFQATGTNFYPNLTNGAPGTVGPTYTGGASDCAFYNCIGTVSGTTRPLTLTAAINYDVQSNLLKMPSALRRVSTGWPAGDAAGLDLYEHMARDANSSSLGPVEDCRNWRHGRSERYWKAA